MQKAIFLAIAIAVIAMGIAPMANMAFAQTQGTGAATATGGNGGNGGSSAINAQGGNGGSATAVGSGSGSGLASGSGSGTGLGGAAAVGGNGGNGGTCTDNGANGCSAQGGNGGSATSIANGNTAGGSGSIVVTPGTGNGASASGSTVTSGGSTTTTTTLTHTPFCVSHPDVCFFHPFGAGIFAIHHHFFGPGAFGTVILTQPIQVQNEEQIIAQPQVASCPDGQVLTANGACVVVHAIILQPVVTSQEQASQLTTDPCPTFNNAQLTLLASGQCALTSPGGENVQASFAQPIQVISGATANCATTQPQVTILQGGLESEGYSIHNFGFGFGHHVFGFLHHLLGHVANNS